MVIQNLILEELTRLVKNPIGEDLGDILIKVIEIRSRINDKATSMLAETLLINFRGQVARAEIGQPLFISPDLPNRDLTDLESLQLIGVERALYELCFCFENLEYASAFTWGGSTPTRFYLNSVYHYVSSMFLIDTSKSSHKNLPMGGTVIRALDSIGLSDLLNPIDKILQKQNGDKGFGESILLLRHSHLVHGDFSPTRIEYLIDSTQMRNQDQQ